MRKILPILFILHTCCFFIKAQTFSPVVIPGSETRKITSSIIHQEYELQVFLPAGYAKTTKKYPVLYLMDSQWDFPLVQALYGQQYFDGFLPPMIIVGVTWGGNHPNPDSLRARDYTPTNENRLPQSGGAANFLAFFQKELFPFVEANYQVDNTDRTLMGCSLGGLFTLYTLFTHPGLFQRYVAASPAIGWDKEVLYQYEKAYFNKPHPAGRLFLCVGGVERSVPGFERFAKSLTAGNDTLLHIKPQVLENTGHSGTKGEGYAQGLKYVFARPIVHLPAETLQQYTGSYTTANGNDIAIKKDNNNLVLYFGSNNQYTLYAADETHFYATSEFLNIHFTKDNKGAVTDFQMERYNSGTVTATKK